MRSGHGSTEMKALTLSDYPRGNERIFGAESTYRRENIVMRDMIVRRLRPIVWISLSICVGLLFLARPAIGAGYKVLSETSFPIDAPLPQVASIRRTKDGGYMFVGRALTRQLWVVKTNLKGEKEWERIIDGRRYSSRYTEGLRVTH